MISRGFRPFIYAQNFHGVNSKDTHENILDGEWSVDSINVFSDPQGSLASRPGFSSITSVSIGADKAWTGFYQLFIHSGGSSTAHFV